jgi:hypothetical protein
LRWFEATPAALKENSMLNPVTDTPIDAEWTAKVTNPSTGQRLVKLVNVDLTKPDLAFTEAEARRLRDFLIAALD